MVQTKLVVSLMPDSLSAAAELDVTAYEGADILEWRADFLPMDAIFKVAPTIFEKFSAFPIVFTLRTTREGGLADVPDVIYSYILKRMADEFAPAFIDVETFSYPDALEQLTDAGFGKEKIILSYHNMHELPRNIMDKMEKMAAEKPAFVKVAVYPQTKAEVLAWMQFCRVYADTFDVPLIAMGMGKLSAATRILSALTGSSWTFASVGEKTSADGQFPLAITRALLELMETEE
ncbi:MAG: type I 3-dehydroquinate dehydratase [Streptococcaceae bacterium]|jgi:3-dehydroquinate dehydratase-1|nr:type I 3-dehydroquinate dehydratase [Streptococcaceae bacterium]